VNKLLTSVWAVCLTLLILTAVRYWDPTPIEILRLKNFDAYQSLLTPTVSEKIVLMDWGEKQMKQHGQWPWPRDIIAQEVVKLYQAGAGLVILNMVFPEEDRMGQDAALINVMSQVPVVLTQVASTRAVDGNATPRGLSYSGNPFPYLFDYPGAVMNIKSIADVAAGVGMEQLLLACKLLLHLYTAVKKCAKTVKIKEKICGLQRVI